MLNNKNGQLGETMTWVVATLAIIVILVLAIFAANILAKTKANPSSFFSLGYSRNNDVLMQESLFSYFVSDNLEQKKIIKERLRAFVNEDFSYDYNYDLDSNFHKLSLVNGGNNE